MKIDLIILSVEKVTNVQKGHQNKNRGLLSKRDKVNEGARCVE